MITKEKCDEIRHELARNLFTWQEVIEFCYLTTMELDDESLTELEQDFSGDEYD